MDATGKRLDVVAAQLFPEYSRARIQSWIKSGELRVNNTLMKPNAKLLGGETLQVEALCEAEGDWAAEPLALAVVYEDDALLVINKPAGLVVHPAAGHYTGTLLNGLLHYHPPLIDVPRAGIVHRLDKDTTGLMVVAKTLTAQTRLVAMLQARSVSRQYVALVFGTLTGSGKVDEPIGRDPNNRKKMAVVSSGKEAKTHYCVANQIGPFSWVRLQLETGRTHQIRVHMTHLGHPLVGDPMYGRKSIPQKAVTASQYEALKAFNRQALHAQSLSLRHPVTDEPMSWQVPLPEDLLHLLEILGLEC